MPRRWYATRRLAASKTRAAPPRQVEKFVLSAIAPDGLWVRRFKKALHVPWSDIQGVSAGLQSTEDGVSHLAIAADIKIGMSESLLIVLETERLWVSLCELFPQFVPQMPAFEVWACDVVTSGYPISIYDQAV